MRHTVRIWDAATGRELKTLESEGCLTAIEFSPDGERLAVGRYDGSAIIWGLTDAESQVISTLSGHSAFIPSLSFSPYGDLLATASFDGTAKVWDLNTGQEWLTFHTQGAVTRVVFSPDGKHLATAGFDGRVRIWVLDLEELVELAESRVTRSLTQEECHGPPGSPSPCPGAPAILSTAPPGLPAHTSSFQPDPS